MVAYVAWDKNSKVESYRCGADGKYNLVFADAEGALPCFRWEDVTEEAVVTATYTGAATDTLLLKGDAQHRVTKLCAWLPQNGLEQCGAPKDVTNEKGYIVRTIFFTRADVPF